MIRRFSFDLHHAEVLFGQIVVKGTSKIGEEAQRFGFERFQPFEQIMAGTLLGAPARVGFRLQFGQRAMEGEAAPDGRPITVDEGRAFIGRECRRARLARLCTARLASRSMSRMASAQGSLSNSIRLWSSRRIWALQKA